MKTCQQTNGQFKHIIKKINSFHEISRPHSLAKIPYYSTLTQTTKLNYSQFPCISILSHFHNLDDLLVYIWAKVSVWAIAILQSVIYII